MSSSAGRSDRDEKVAAQERGPDYVSGAVARANQLEKLAQQAEAVKWSVPAVLRENASLIRQLAAEIHRLRNAVEDDGA